MLDLLNRGAAEAPAIMAPGRAPLSYGALRRLVGDTAASLNRLGIGRNDRVAIVLPNGPEMAAAFLAVGSAATSAPLNPAYRAEEFEFYLTDLSARALLVEAGSDSPAVAVAERLGIPILRLEVGDGAAAGAFTLAGRANGAAARPGLAEPSDIALVLHTSGTTSRPKIVPLSQRQYRRLGPPHPRLARARSERPLPQRHAALPHPRPDRGASVLAVGRRQRRLHARFQRAEVLPVAR